MSISLYYHFLCPFSKQISILLKELGIAHTEIERNFWEADKDFKKLSMWGEMPVMKIDNNIIVGAYPCFEYIIASNKTNYLLSPDIAVLTNIRQVINWFNKHFYDQVTQYIVYEKLVKTYQTNKYIDMQIVRMAQKNLHEHMSEVKAIIDMQGYLVYGSLSYADIVVASHLAVVDYFGDINWSLYPRVQEWYCLIKSRPYFRISLEGNIMGISPSSNYFKLDF